MRNSRSMHATVGSRVYATKPRAEDDFYATDPKALRDLLDVETFSHKVWEPACGQGHLSKVLEEYGYQVRSSDLIDRGYGESGVDFLSVTAPFDGDIITNPPYTIAAEFVQKALDLVSDGHKVAMLLRLQFLEGKNRRKLFDSAPPLKIYVFSSRIKCAAGGDFDSVMRAGAIAFAWFVWEKGNTQPPIIKWLN